MKMRRTTFLFGSFIAGYILVFAGATAGLYRAFGYYDFDLAVHVQSVWKLLHGSLFNTILGIPFPGNHMHLILFLVAPVYAVFRNPLTLLFIQTAALGCAAIPLYKLAARRLDEDWALVIGVSYLVYPALSYVNLYEFHPTALAVFFISWMLYWYEQKSFRKFLLWAFCAVLCQENIPLCVIMVGLLSFIERRAPKWGISAVAGGLIFFVAAVSLMAYFNAHTIDYVSLYRYLGATPADAFRNMVFHPDRVFAMIGRARVGVYLVQLFAPVVFIPFLAPLKLLPLAPFLAQHILSVRPSELSITYHYTAEMIPFIFYALIYGIQRINRLSFAARYSDAARACVLGSAFLSAYLLGPLPRMPQARAVFIPDYQDVFKDELIRQVPPGASVVATFEFLPHLANRPQVYSLHHQYMGAYTLSARPYRLPDGVRYALIDFNDFLTFRGFYRPDGYRNLQEFFGRGSWRVVDMRDNCVLLKNGPSAGPALCELLPAGTAVPASGKPVSVNGSISLIAYDAVCSADHASLDLVLYWQCRKETRRDIAMQIDFSGGDARPVMRTVRPIGYRIYPTQSWQESQVYRERVRLYIPGFLRTQKWMIHLAFFDQANGSFLPVDGAQDGYRTEFIGASTCMK